MGAERVGGGGVFGVESRLPFIRGGVYLAGVEPAGFEAVVVVLVDDDETGESGLEGLGSLRLMDDGAAGRGFSFA